MAYLSMILQVSNCGMSDTIGPVHVKERPSVEMQSRIDAEVPFHRPLRYSDNILALLFHFAIHLARSGYIFGQMLTHVVCSFILKYITDVS